jgi:hypothetical protein
MAVKRLKVLNRSYAEAMWQIEIIMANQELIRIFREFCEVTDGDRVAAAILTDISVRMDTGKLIEKMQEEPRSVPGMTPGTF